MSSRVPKPQEDGLVQRMAAPAPDLRQVLEGALPYEDAREAVQWAGLSEDPSLIPQLKEIAELTSGERNLRLTFDALCGAWLLGEPRDYFLANAQAHASRKWLAYYSILLLGRVPDDGQVAAVLEAIKTESADNQVQGAIAEAGRVRALSLEYPDNGTVEDKTLFLLRYSRGEWSPIALDPPLFGWSLNPLTDWAHRKLRTLAQEDAGTVARTIAQLDLSAEYPDDQGAAYRSYLLSLISSSS